MTNLDSIYVKYDGNFMPTTSCVFGYNKHPAVRAHAHRTKAERKAKKKKKAKSKQIKIKDKTTNIKENFHFRFHFRCLWMSLNEYIFCCEGIPSTGVFPKCFFHWMRWIQWQQESILVRCGPSSTVTVVGGCKGGVPARGCTFQRGCTCLGHVPARGWTGLVSQHILGQTPPPPWTEWLRVDCENITLPLLRTVKIFVITVKGFEPNTSCVGDKDVTSAPVRHMWETGSLNWA